MRCAAIMIQGRKCNACILKKITTLPIQQRIPTVDKSEWKDDFSK